MYKSNNIKKPLCLETSMEKKKPSAKADGFLVML